MSVAYRTLGYHETPVRVQFGHVDRYGAMWHGHMVSFCEIARADLARPFGLGVLDLLQLNLVVPMLELAIQYKAPALDDEALVVQSTLLEPELPLPELVFLYRLVRAGTGVELIHARTRQLLMRRDGRVIVRVPPPIVERLERVWSHLATRPTWADPSQEQVS